jgi:NAD(P)-dependent dehydrogenase (short-subunit alcohol dehydrogenase family)
MAVVPVAADAATDDGIATVLERARTPTDALRSGQHRRRRGARHLDAATRVSRQAWRDLFAQNLETMFFMSQAVAAELRAQGLPGSIVSLSSISGMNTAPYHVAYGTAKAAIVAATRTMAAELAAEGIRVNAIAPGVTETPASAPTSTRIRSGTCAPSRWAAAAGPPNRPAPSCSCCRTCRATSPVRPCWSTAV